MEFASDPAIREFLVPSGFTFQDLMTQEIPPCLQSMIVNEVPTRVSSTNIKQRSRRFQTMVIFSVSCPRIAISLTPPCFFSKVLGIQVDHSLPDEFGFPHVIFNTIQSASGFFRQMQSTQTPFRLLLESIQDPSQTEAFYHRARDGKVFNRA